MRIVISIAALAVMVPAGAALAQQPAPTGRQAGGAMESGVKGGPTAKAMKEMSNHHKRMMRHHVMDRRHLHVNDKNPSQNEFK